LLPYSMGFTFFFADTDHFFRRFSVSSEMVCIETS